MLPESTESPRSTEKGAKEPTAKERYHRVERYYGKVTRSMTLPNDVDEDNIQADLKLGVLTLSIPKLAQDQLPEKARKVEIQ
jgi:HSP20 family protein